MLKRYLTVYGAPRFSNPPAGAFDALTRRRQQEGPRTVTTVPCISAGVLRSALESTLDPDQNTRVIAFVAFE